MLNIVNIHNKTLNLNLRCKEFTDYYRLLGSWSFINGKLIYV